MWLKTTRLSRITDGKTIIPEIEGLRFIAVVMVILSHINNITLSLYPSSLRDHYSSTRLGIFLEECGSGVQLFFFISGFILALPFLKAYVYGEGKISVKHYYYRRLTRIEPPYIISLVLFTIAVMLILKQPFADSIQHFFASLFYIHNIAYNDISSINPVAWSLEIEIQYYLLFPLIAACLFIKKNTARRLLLLLFFIITASMYSYHLDFFAAHRLTRSILAYIPFFTGGIIAAEIYLSAASFSKIPNHYLFDITGIAGLYFSIILSGYQDPVYRGFIQLCYIILLIAFFKGKILNKVFTKKWIVITGGMCYSIYLMHYAVIHFMLHYITWRMLTFNFEADMLIQFILIAPFIFAASMLFFIYFERPFMDIKWPHQLKMKIRK